MTAQLREQKTDDRSQNQKSGFTLIELMVVTAVIAILAAVGLVVYSTAQKNGRVSKRIQDLQSIQTALELFKGANGFYPNVTTAGSFVCLDSLTGVNSLVPNYMPQIPRDPIQSAVGGTNCYKYTSDVGGGGPTATIYKAKTTIGATEMSPSDFAQQPQLVDPDSDGAADDNCVVTPAGGTAWAVYSSTNTACNYGP